MATFNTATAIVNHPNGTATSYLATANTDAARGVAILAAVAAATSGDTIAVFGSAAITQNIAKNGVNWHFNAGVTITLDNNLVGFIFDDGGAAMSYTISGRGNFVRNITPSAAIAAASNSVGVMQVSNVSSNVKFDYGTASVYVAIASDPSFNSGGVVIIQQAGTLTVNGQITMIETDDTVAGTGNIGWYWLNGEWNGFCNQFVMGSRNALPVQDSTLVYADCETTPTGDFRVMADVIDARNGYGSAIYSDSTQATAAMWVTANQIFGFNDISQGGKTYVSALKHNGIFAVNGGLCYLNFRKVGGDLPTSIANSNALLVTGGTAYVTIDQFDAGTRLKENISVTGGILYFSGQDITGQSGQDNIIVSNGVANLLSGIATKATGKTSIKRTGGTCNVGPGFIYLLADTSGTIVTLNLYGVVPGSTFKSTTLGT